MTYPGLPSQAHDSLVRGDTAQHPIARVCQYPASGLLLLPRYGKLELVPMQIRETPLSPPGLLSPKRPLFDVSKLDSLGVQGPEQLAADGELLLPYTQSL